MMLERKNMHILFSISVPEVEGNIEDHQPHPAHSSTKFADDEQDISCDEEDEISKEPGN